MIWTSLFSIAIAQGIFLIFIFSLRKSQNLNATRILTALLVLFVLSNFDDLLISTMWYKSIPWVFGLSLGSMFAYGPLLYLYTLALTDNAFTWRKKTWLHFIPYGLNLIVNMPLFFLPTDFKIRFLDAFVAGQLSIRVFDLVLIAAQMIHFCIYLWFAFRWINTLQVSQGNISYMISIHKRVNWLRTLSLLFLVFLITVLTLYIVIFIKGHFLATANYAFTLVTSAIIYYTAFKLMLNPDLVTPGFAKKYKSVRLENSDEQASLTRLKEIMEKDKVYTQSDLKLASLARQLNITPHQLSKIINDHFGKSFSDFVNQYRVQEFLVRLEDPQYATHNLMGIAWDVGFNSKSAFNVAFKKITGKNPSDFRK